MSDLIKALLVCLNFMPETKAPGVDGVFFDFPEENTAHLYACDGHMMLRFVLVGVPTTGTGETYFLPANEVKKMIHVLEKALDISVMAFGNDVMFMAGDLVETIHRQEDQFRGKYREFFMTDQVPEQKAMIDYLRMKKVMDLVLPFMKTYSDSGPGFEIEIHKNKTNEKVDGNLALIIPYLSEDLPNIESIKIVIMGMVP